MAPQISAVKQKNFKDLFLEQFKLTKESREGRDSTLEELEDQIYQSIISDKTLSPERYEIVAMDSDLVLSRCASLGQLLSTNTDQLCYRLLDIFLSSVPL